MRDWAQTHAKAAAARGCVCCGRTGPLERAHLIGRARDRGVVQADEITLLCGPFPHGCHGRYDRHQLDLYPYLTDRERRGAVRAAGSPGLALRRLSGPLWHDPAAARLLDARLMHLALLSTQP